MGEWWRPKERMTWAKAMVALAVVAAFGALTYCIETIGYITVNTTDSIHASWIYVQRNVSEIRQGDYVAFRFPLEGDKYLPAGAKMFKRITCMPGQRVYSRGLNYYCDDLFLGRANTTDLFGDPLVARSVDRVIPRGHFWVGSEQERSYDSKYWGLISKRDIVGKVRVLVHGKAVRFLANPKAKKIARAYKRYREAQAQTAALKAESRHE